MLNFVCLFGGGINIIFKKHKKKKILIKVIQTGE